MSPSLGVSSPFFFVTSQAPSRLRWNGASLESPKALWPSLPPKHLESLFHTCFCTPHAVLWLPCLHAGFFYRSSMKGWHTILCLLSTQESLWHIISAQYICLKGRNDVPQANSAPWLWSCTWWMKISVVRPKMNWPLWSPVWKSLIHCPLLATGYTKTLFTVDFSALSLVFNIPSLLGSSYPLCSDQEIQKASLSCESEGYSTPHALLRYLHEL